MILKCQTVRKGARRIKKMPGSIETSEKSALEQTTICSVTRPAYKISG